MYQYIAKVRDRIIRSERIPHFNVISFEEDQLVAKQQKKKKIQCHASGEKSSTFKQTNDISCGYVK